MVCRFFVYRYMVMAAPVRQRAAQFKLIDICALSLALPFADLKRGMTGDALAKRRKKSNLTQAQLAKLLKSSQSRVAKMEKGDPTVSVDLLVKSLLAMGANKKSIAKAIA